MSMPGYQNQKAHNVMHMDNRAMNFLDQEGLTAGIQTLNPGRPPSLPPLTRSGYCILRSDDSVPGEGQNLVNTTDRKSDIRLETKQAKESLLSVSQASNVNLAGTTFARASLFEDADELLGAVGQSGGSPPNASSQPVSASTQS